MIEPELQYTVDAAQLGPTLSPHFVGLERDAATDAWLADIGAQPHGRATTAAVGLLSRFGSIYDVHGWLGAYAMHLLSEAQFRTLLGAGPFASLLDVGAGAGYVTSQARGLFQEVVCTETSTGLARRLRKRGFEVHAQDLSESPLGRQFAVVCCLNVLDRTMRPLTLLTSLQKHLAPGGRLVVTVPLPVSAHVQVAGATVSAQERLPAAARSFETAARELTDKLFVPAGLQVRSFSRVPYLSRGDTAAPYYVLDAGVWVLGN